jgi:hypothetical protein
MFLRKIVHCCGIFLIAFTPLCFGANDVTLPLVSSSMDAALSALYLKLGNNLSVLTSSIYSDRLYQYPLAWSWGFKLEGAHHFNAGSDSSVSWYHLNLAQEHRQTEVYSRPQASGVVLFAFELNPQWDSLNVEFGQTIVIKSTSKIRLHGGMEFARILNGLSSVSANEAGHINQNSNFNGLGPHLGVDLSWYVLSNARVYINSSTSLLIGDKKIQNESSIFDNYHIDKVTMVPEMRAALGIDYRHKVTQGFLVADVGWLWFDYFNAQTLFSLIGNQANDAHFYMHVLTFGIKWLGDPN